MKILQVLKTSDGANWAFVQAEELRKKGIEIVTILPNDTGNIALKYKENGMKIIVGDFSLPIKKPWTFFKKKRELINIIEKEKPDLIHFHFVTNILFARLALRSSKIPRLFQVPGPLHLENKLIRRIEICLANEYDYWAPSCTFSQKIYGEYIDKEKIFLAYYGGAIGKDILKFSNNSEILHREYNIPQKNILIGMISYFYKPKYYLGQIRGIKGHEDFIDAIKILNNKYDNITALIIGGPWGNSQKYFKRVKKYANNVKNIIFTGHRDDIKKIYKELNMVVHPSHSENLGGAAESLAASVPTIATNVGGFMDIVKNKKTGLLCETKNPKDLANTIEYAIENYDEMKKFSENGLELIKEMLDIEYTANKIKEIYEYIIERKDK